MYDVPGAGFVSGIANGFDSLWVAGASLYQLNINTGKIVSKIDTGAAPENVIVASDFLWVTNSDGDLLKINPSDNSTVETKDLYPSRAGELAVGGAVWVAGGELTNTVTRLPLPPSALLPPSDVVFKLLACDRSTAYECTVEGSFTDQSTGEDGYEITINVEVPGENFSIPLELSASPGVGGVVKSVQPIDPRVGLRDRCCRAWKPKSKPSGEVCRVITEDLEPHSDPNS